MSQRAADVDGSKRGCCLCAQIDGRPSGDLIHLALGAPTDYERRVAAENAESVAIPSLGPLVDGHMLVCPRDHYRSLASTSPQVRSSVFRLAETVAELLSSYRGAPVHRFEHGNATQSLRVTCSVEHSHLHLVPATVAPEAILDAVATWQRLDELDRLPELTKGREYLLLQLDGQPTYLSVAEDGPVPSQLLRRAFATALGRPDEWNWRTDPKPHAADRAYRAVRELALPAVRP